jgi:hypothetical protein
MFPRKSEESLEKFKNLSRLFQYLGLELSIFVKFFEIYLVTQSLFL